MTSLNGDGPIRVFLICHFQVFRAALRSLLESQSGLEVVGEAGSGSAALRQLDTKPDLFLFEQDRDGETQIGFLPQLLNATPGARAVILTSASHPEIHARAVRMGAMGVVGENEPPEVLVRAIEQVHRGEAWLEPATVARVLSALLHPPRPGERPGPRGADNLTVRERQVVSLVGEALSNRQIAQRLHISDVTVRHHLTSIFSKLGFSCRVELAQFAYLHGLARLAPSGTWGAHRALLLPRLVDGS